MAFTRKMLAAMGIEPEKIDQIIEAHAEVTDALKAKAAEAEARAAELEQEAKRVPELEAKVEELGNAQADDGELEALRAEYDAYKAQVAAEAADREKAGLYREMLREAGVDAKRLDAIMRITDLTGVEVEDGAIKGADALKEAAAEEWAAFIPQVKMQGANVPEPPTSGHSSGADDHVAKRLRERHERRFGKAENTATRED